MKKYLLLALFAATGMAQAQQHPALSRPRQRAAATGHAHVQENPHRQSR